MKLCPYHFIIFIFFNSPVFANNFKIRTNSKPIEQRIELVLDPSQDVFTGKVEIDLEILEDTKDFEISAIELNLSKVDLYALRKNQKKCQLQASTIELQKIKLSCNKIIKKGLYSLKIDYNARYNLQGKGLYKTIDRNVPYLFTQFEAIDARRAFPLYDEPIYKIPYQITIVSPKELKVVSNAAIVSTKLLNNNHIKHVFAKTKPLPSYLLAIAVGKFEEKTLNVSITPSKLYTTQDKISSAAYAGEEIPKILSELQKYFEIPYAFGKMDHIAAPEFNHGAMENAGLIAYKDINLLVDKDNSSLDSKKLVIKSIIHEISHQWFGNLVTMAWWDDLWLNEAFASWITQKMMIENYPEFHEELSLPQQWIMSSDANAKAKAIQKEISNESDIFDGLGAAYGKGSAVLTMIENWIGAEAMQKGIRTYLRNHSFKNAKGYDLWNALSHASNKDVASVMSSFITQPGFPLISLSKKGDKLMVSQQRYLPHSDGIDSMIWNIPIVLKYGVAGQVKTMSFLLSNKEQVLAIEPNIEWIYPDADAKGYYYWQLEDDLMSKLMKNAPLVLNDREKLSLIGSLRGQLRNNRLKVSDFLEAMETFLDEKETKVVSSAFDQIFAQKYTFVDEENKSLWNRYIVKFSEKLLKRYGEEKRINEEPEIGKFRADLFWILTESSNQSKYAAIASEKAQEILAKKPQKDPSLTEIYLYIAAYYGDEVYLQQVLAQIKKTNDPRLRQSLVSSLCCFSDKKLKQKVLDSVLTDDIKPSDIGAILWHYADFNMESQKLISQWFFNHYDQIVKKVSESKIENFINVTWKSCDQKSFDQAKSFFLSKVEKSPGIARVLDKSESSLKNCLILKGREQKNFNQYIEQ